jgi:hypothetical protein
MDPARVQWAVETLEANRDPVSARTVLRLLRRTPPYTGGSFTDVLRLLKIQAVPSDAERALAEIEERTAGIR